jgi:hypothetical protein
MTVWDAENFQDALQRAILAGPPVQNVERDIGLRGGERVGDPRRDVNVCHPKAKTDERFGASAARPQRDLALG